jgi:hypothetical protein
MFIALTQAQLSNEWVEIFFEKSKKNPNIFPLKRTKISKPVSTLRYPKFQPNAQSNFDHTQCPML